MSVPVWLFFAGVVIPPAVLALVHRHPCFAHTHFRSCRARAQFGSSKKGGAVWVD